MQTRFLLGPAGSGKTFRCLAEIRAELLASPEGAPLILLAPKQATFQLERQLLAEASLAGFTRLHIFSFERLAEFVLAQSRQSPPRLLDEEGRVMVLRALLARRRDELQLFRASARLPGFAQQLGLLIRELQRYQIAPAQLERLAANAAHPLSLRGKLSDVAVLLRAYRDWLQVHALQDADGLLDVATRAARASPKLGGLWLDGFAEMTPQELDLLAALLPSCPRAALAFCLEAEPRENVSWLSTWSVVSQTFRNCFQKLVSVPGCNAVVEVLPRDARAGRFAGNLPLQHLEQFWSNPVPFDLPGQTSDGQLELGLEKRETPSAALRIVTCDNIEAEAKFAAREILRFTRAGGRFRDVAILLRQLPGYDEALRRAFNRFGIPFFLDRREPVAHHPLAELTRFALRTLAFGWTAEDWFGALKTGLVQDDDAAIDRLENIAIAHGWKGNAWLEPLRLPEEPDLENFVEPLRRKLVGPFLRLAKVLADDDNASELRPTGAQLANGLRDFWNELQVERTLTQWSTPAKSEEQMRDASAVHLAVWQQMQNWIENLALAFATERLSLRAWLPILEAGLAGLTVGVVPPALDQVLIGTVDRSRNPDLKFALVLGLNESVFPAPPGQPTLLTEADRAALESANLFLGPSVRHKLGHERYYGYIACTRARERLLLTCAAQDADGRALNPSPFFSHVSRLFPNLTPEKFSGRSDWLASEHPSELLPALVQDEIGAEKNERQPELRVLARLPLFADALCAARSRFDLTESLSPAMAESLHGRTLRTSVSRIEEFAACPFKFFISSGLRARERDRFELDVRERGSFQHEVLALFHQRVREENKEWRDLNPAEARARVASAAAELAPKFRDGLLLADNRSRFTARSLSAALEDYVATAVEWMSQYEFNPRAVELAFGLRENSLPPWTLDLDERHQLAFGGKIDRVDLWLRPDSDAALCVVIDYKSSAREIDPVLLENGVQLQLPAYLKVLEQVPAAAEHFGLKQFIPAGVFYVNLRGNYKASASRQEVFTAMASARARAYQHHGRFDVQVLRKLDNRENSSQGDQFKFSLKKSGELSKRGNDGMEPQAFAALLAGVESVLKEMGREIFAGVAHVDPYRHRGKTPCEHCDYRAICRIDPWTHFYRPLKEPAGSA
ncbi:MAG: PD-(D/E)XK nuclease family protein [Verrucomicrobia bacterium]|nr:PD-(D/E)XK nuclease family protein [Verrucomicrobiota bacterium]